MNIILTRSLMTVRKIQNAIVSVGYKGGAIFSWRFFVFSIAFPSKAGWQKKHNHSKLKDIHSKPGLCVAGVSPAAAADQLLTMLHGPLLLASENKESHKRQ